VISGD